MLKDSQVDLCGRTDFTRTAPLLARDEAFSFACAGCGGCCRGREDIVLSGFDLWRIAARLRLPPRTVETVRPRRQQRQRLRLQQRTPLPQLRLTRTQHPTVQTPSWRCAVTSSPPAIRSSRAM